MKHAVVLLPQGNPFDRVFAEALSAGAAEAGVSLKRVESEFSTENKLGAICGEIERAELVIADLTARNPNIMYQTGYAHGIGKKLLLITQHGEDFPFDKSRHDLIVYGGDIAFLKAQLVAFLATGKTATKSEEAASAPEVRQIFQSTFGDLLSQHGYTHRGDIYMENPTTFVLVGQDMDLPLVQELARRARELGLRLKLM